MWAGVARMLLQRLGLSIVTLMLLSVVVFAGAQMLPGDVGRAILGPLADAASVAALNHQLGTDLPVPIMYWNWIRHFVVGDMGMSYTFHSPVAPFIVTRAAELVETGGGRLRHRGATVNRCRRLRSDAHAKLGRSLHQHRWPFHDGDPRVRLVHCTYSGAGRVVAMAADLRQRPARY